MAISLLNGIKAQNVFLANCLKSSLIKFEPKSGNNNQIRSLSMITSCGPIQAVVKSKLENKFKVSFNLIFIIFYILINVWTQQSIK